MNTPHGRTPSRRSRNAWHPHPARATPFKVFIAYADLVAARHATTTIADAIRSSRHHVDLHPLLWRFEQLASDHWAERARHAALEADVIVLATSEPGPLLPGVEKWVDDFLRANRGRPATLVAVTGSSEAWTISIEETPCAASTGRLVAAEPALAGRS